MEMDEEELAKLGIFVVKELNEREKRYVSTFVANKITDTYPDYKFGYFNIFSILYNTPMYFAKLPNGMSSVNYVYKNFTLYFAENKDVFDFDEFTLHECIHRIQDKRNRAGRLKQMGNCEFTDTKIKGLNFNEAAVQYLTSKMLEKENKEIRVLNISLNTISPNYYSIITNLMEQIVLLGGEDEIVKSTILGNNDFNYDCIDNFGEGNFAKIRENFDKITNLINSKTEENLIQIEEDVSKIYFETQKLIYTSYFNKIVSRINKLDEVEYVRQKLYEYAKLIFNSEKFEEFKNFYNEKIEKLKEVEFKVKNKYALAPLNKNIFSKMFLAIKKLFYKGNTSNENIKE